MISRQAEKDMVRSTVEAVADGVILSHSLCLRSEW